MQTGMLWFDNDKKPLAEKVQKAAAYYQKKYGARPTVCFVPPVELSDQAAIDGIQIVPSRQILKNHLWLGIKEG